MFIFGHFLKLYTDNFPDSWYWSKHLYGAQAQEKISALQK